MRLAETLALTLALSPRSLLKNVWFAAWGHAAYKISSEIRMPGRPGALTGRLFQRAPSAKRCGAIGGFIAEFSVNL